MKKFRVLLIVCSLFAVAGFGFLNANSKPIDVVVYGSHVVYEYNELVDEADVVALVKVKDGLSKKNSTIVYLPDSPFILYHYATREVEVLEYYKNDMNLPQNISFNEPVAITPDNEYIFFEDYDALEKGKKYIVYLSKNNGLEELSIISQNNGKVQLDDFSRNEYQDIAVRSILKANNIELPKHVELNFDVPETMLIQHKAKEVKSMKSKNAHIDIPLTYYFDKDTNTEYINIGGIEFSVNQAILSLE